MAGPPELPDHHSTKGMSSFGNALTVAPKPARTL